MLKLVSILMISLILTACLPSVEKEPGAQSLVDQCNDLCQKKFHTNVSYVGAITGTCYCK